MNAMRSWQLFFLLVGLILVAQVPGESVVQAAPRQATTISASLSNPTCVEALPASGVCRIEFGSITASGSDPSFSRLEADPVNGIGPDQNGGDPEKGGSMSAPAHPNLTACAVSCTESDSAQQPVPGIMREGSIPPATSASSNSMRSATDSEFASEFVPKQARPTFWEINHLHCFTNRSASGE